MILMTFFEKIKMAAAMKNAGSQAKYLNIMDFLFLYINCILSASAVIIPKTQILENSYRERSCFARARLSIMEWITGTKNIATIPPAKPLLYRFIPPYTMPTLSATDE